MTGHGELMNGALDPIVTIILCVICAIGLVAWTARRSP